MYSRPKLVKQCKHCQSTFETRDRRQTFCSRSCVAVHYNTISRVHHTEESKRKLSEHFKANLSGGAAKNNYNKLNNIPSPERIAYNAVPRLCEICSQPIPFSYRRNKTCSAKCRSKIIGGPRKGSGRSKHGWYQGIYCDSLYELAFVIYQLDQGVTIERSKTVIPYLDENDVERKYYPDFEIDGVLYEIKGWITERTKLKIAAAPKNMIVIAGESEIAPFVEYACAKHQRHYERLVEVYDRSSCLTEHTCSNCGINFVRKKSKKPAFACSQVCVGKLAVKRRLKEKALKRLELSPSV